MALEITNRITINIYAQSAEAAPPLGTVLGNLGVNAIKFAKEFNEFTSELPNYFKLRVLILIYENKSYQFSVKICSNGFILNSLILEDEIIGNYILLSELIKVAKFKFEFFPLKYSLKLLIASVHAASIKIYNDLEDDEERLDNNEIQDDEERLDNNETQFDEI